MPEDQQEQPQPEEQENPQEEQAKKKSGLQMLQIIWIYHPLAMLALALVIAMVTYSLLPEQTKKEPKPLSFLYSQTLQAIRRVRNPLLDASRDEIVRDTQQAKTNMDYIIHHANYRKEITESPGLINPFLLYGESLYLYATNPDIPQEDSKENYKLAFGAFGRALNWEQRQRPERAQREYDKQFFEDNEPFDERVLQARKMLRRQYLRYMRGLSALKAGELNLAADDLDKLKQQFDLESMQVPSNEQSLWNSMANLPPHEFELMPEDRVLLYYYQGRLAQLRDNREEAVRNFQIFLLNAKRSREYFSALMQLGNFYFNDAMALRKTDPTGSRRLFGEATEIFNRMVTASPPGDILREAYFTGGRAYLNMAVSLPANQRTVWDRAMSFAEDAGQFAQKLNNGKKLPGRTREIIPAISRMQQQASLTLGSPAGFSLQTASAIMGNLLTKERLTTEGERKKLLQRAKAFFTGSQGGPGLKYDGASYIMLAYTYMAEGEYEKSRGLQRYTRSKFWKKDIELSSLLGVAVSYLKQGELDKAFVRLIGGVEKDGLSLFIEDDIKDWVGLCSAIYQGSVDKGLNPGKRLWGFFTPATRDIIQKTSLTGELPIRYRQIIVSKLNEVLNREDLYTPKYFPESIKLPQTAQIMLKGEIPLLKLQDRQWLNRMLLDAAFQQYIHRTPIGEIIAPYPPQSEVIALGDSVLLNKELISDYLKELSRKYVNQANHAARELDELTPRRKEISEQELRLAAAAPRRALEKASQSNRFLIKNYPPEDIGVIMMENAGILTRRARLAGGEPFHNTKIAKRLISEAATAYAAIGESGKYLKLEPEALLEAGRNFYASGQYGRASEVLARFDMNYGKNSPDIGWARNLLGRCYWYQGRYKDAERVFRSNAKRKTSDGRESLYYLGAVFLDAGSMQMSSGSVDLLGSPQQPYPVNDQNGIPQMTTALQVFNEIRRTPQILPSSRPWRWATFGLGKVWYKIAERAELEETAKAKSENRQPAPVAWLPYYEEAEKVLREGLERYRLKYSPSDEIGISVEKQPEDYYDIMRQRQESEYYLALTLKALAEERVEMDDAEVRQRLRDVINLELYPKELSEIDTERLMLSNRSVLGVTEGPIVRPKYLDSIRKISYFLLAQSWRDLARKQEMNNQPTLSQKSYDKALQVYRNARDQLSLLDGPRILYNMGEVMISLGKTEDAKRIFLMAISQVSQLESTDQDEQVKQALDIWKKLASDRIVDLDNKIGY